MLTSLQLCNADRQTGAASKLPVKSSQHGKQAMRSHSMFSTGERRLADAVVSYNLTTTLSTVVVLLETTSS